MTMDEMFEENGWREDTLHGSKHYVTTDEDGRSVVGPVRHRKGWLARRRLRRGDGFVADSNDETVVIDPTGVEVVSSLRSRLRAKFYDREWHNAVQHTAVDLLAWSVSLSIAAVALKGAWWVVGL